MYVFEYNSAKTDFMAFIYIIFLNKIHLYMTLFHKIMIIILLA